GADERRHRAGLARRGLLDDRLQRERLLAEQERPARDRRNERDLVTVRELVVAVDVPHVHGVEEAGRLRAQAERLPDGVDAPHAVELARGPAGAFAQPGEETNRHPHAAILHTRVRWT